MNISDDDEVALEIAIRTGALRICEMHQYTISGNMNFEKAYKLANKLITERNPLVSQYYDNRRGLTDALKRVINFHAITCPGCAQDS